MLYHYMVLYARCYIIAITMNNNQYDYHIFSSIPQKGDRLPIYLAMWRTQGRPHIRLQEQGRRAWGLSLCHWRRAADPEILGWPWPSGGLRGRGQDQPGVLRSVLSLEPCSIPETREAQKTIWSLQINAGGHSSYLIFKKKKKKRIIFIIIESSHIIWQISANIKKRLITR